ncbi:MAG: chemotaxis protein CheC [Candidatus Omnitrophica bacterium]|nr:chemotaxis protein CheC [Candidatus Omnitrophota bacterium]
MHNQKDISLIQLDALKEIGTIGIGRAATALSELLNCKVEITLPETKLIPLEVLSNILGEADEVFFVLDISTEGDINGRIFFLLTPEEARILGGALLGKSPQDIDAEDLLFQSSLKELVNILVGAYMNALSDMTGLTIMYNVPNLAVDMVTALLDFFFIHIAQHSDDAIFVKTQLKVKDIAFNKGFFLFFPDLESLRRLFSALGIEGN